MNHQLLGYIPEDTPIHRLNGAAKLIALILISVGTMTTYDTRLLLVVAVFSLFLFRISNIKWYQISFVVKFILIFSLINIIAVYLFSPQYGVSIYGTNHVLIEGIGRFNLTSEQLFYELNLILKYFCTIPVALIFILTTNPSEFASSLNKIGISYKISYSVALALRYIPDIQEEYFAISVAQQARGFEMSKKASISQRIKGTISIVSPLILSSIDRIETISTAMELRRFGKNKTRSWYMSKPLTSKDYLTISIAIIILAVSIRLFFVNNGRFYNPFI